MRWLLALALAGPFASTAAAERVAVPSFHMMGIAEPTQAMYRASLAGGLAASGFDLLPEGQLAVTYDRAPGLERCQTSTCFHTLAGLLGVRRLVRAELEMVGTSNFVIALELIDAEDGRAVARVEDRCQVCTQAEANEALSKAAAELGRRAPPLIRPHSSPSTVGATSSASAPRHSVFRSLGIASAVIGAALSAGGIALLAINGRAEGMGTDPSGRVYVDRLDTLGAGIGVTIAGALLAGGTGLFFWRDRVASAAAVSSTSRR
jgi:hypothetical protein